MRHKRLPNPREIDLHHYTVHLLRQFAAPNVVWWHTANERKTSVRHGSFLKTMGVIAGVPDFCFVFPPAGRVAFLELKAMGGVLSPPQTIFAVRARDAGAIIGVARSQTDINEFLANNNLVRFIAVGAKL